MITQVMRRLYVTAINTMYIIIIQKEKGDNNLKFNCRASKTRTRSSQKMINLAKSSILISLISIALIGTTIQSKKVTLQPNEQLRNRMASSYPSFLSALYDKPREREQKYNPPVTPDPPVPPTPDPPAPPAPVYAEIDPVDNVYIPPTPFTVPTLTPAQVLLMKSFEGFLIGLTAETLVPNTTECFHRITNFTIIQNTRFFYNLDQVKETITYVTTEEDPLNPLHIMTATNTISFYTSTYLQNLTNHLWVCNDMLKNVYKYTNYRALQYNSIVDIFTSFFQSAIGKIISFTAKLTNIQTIMKATKETGIQNPQIWNELGVVVKLLILFEPVSGSGYDTGSERMMMTNGNGLDQTLIRDMPDGSYYISNDGRVQNEVEEGKLEVSPVEKTQDFFGVLYDRPLVESIKQNQLTTAAPPPYTLFFSFTGVFDFFKGVLYGLNIAKAGKMVDCINNANFIVEGGNKTFNTFVSNLTIYGGLVAIDEGLKVLYAAGGLSTDCVQGVTEAQANIFKYLDFLGAPSLLYINLVYNFGLLYDSVKTFVYFFFYPSRNKIATTNELGKQFGSFFYNIFSS
ncbi:hypothetical protein FGO68_gene1656 [Halteria grandinella]|uniref:Uncharacterized protein n=1 Tax=Halteria grandinella TaxID=5974 RepID=A0A8J8T327_HALGN|nr:hypothetical protein FGO68_gene1656 [Halteria grandinella]